MTIVIGVLNLELEPGIGIWNVEFETEMELELIRVDHVGWARSGGWAVNR